MTLCIPVYAESYSKWVKWSDILSKTYTRLRLSRFYSYCNPFRSYIGPRPTLRSSCFRCFSWSLSLSNPIFLPPAYSPAFIYFGREWGWWATCDYPRVLKEKNVNRNRKSTTCAICWLKSVLHEEKRREQTSSDIIFYTQWDGIYKI
jgi:hypothetical protein